MDPASITDEELQAKIGERFTTLMKNNGAKQRVVPEDEVERYIREGWEFVATLSKKRVIVRLPV